MIHKKDKQVIYFITKYFLLSSLIVTNAIFVIMWITLSKFLSQVKQLSKYWYGARCKKKNILQ